MSNRSSRDLSLRVRCLDSMRPTETTNRDLVEALLLGGYLPNFEFSLRLGREVQNEWMNSYQEVQIMNTFKVMVKKKLFEFDDA